MKNIFPALCIGAFAFACAPKTENVSSIVATENKFILDSLLNYDSEEALIAKFGDENIAREEGWYPEGTGQYIATVLYPYTRNEVTFNWDDSASFSQLAYLSVGRDSSDWSTRGVKVGTRLRELVILNGKDFSFSGFGWDYAGVVAWEPGDKLAGIELTLGISNFDEGEQDSLMGDIRISSRSNIAKKNNPYVSQIILTKGDGQDD
jgi:hypothetical protein